MVVDWIKKYQIIFLPHEFPVITILFFLRPPNLLLLRYLIVSDSIVVDYFYSLYNFLHSSELL